MGDEILVKFSEPVKISNINPNNILLNDVAIATMLDAKVSAFADGSSTTVGTATNDGTHANVFKVALGSNGTSVNSGYYYIEGKILKVTKTNAVTIQNVNSSADVEITVPTLPIQP